MAKLQLVVGSRGGAAKLWCVLGDRGWSHDLVMPFIKNYMILITKVFNSTAIYDLT